MGGASGNCRHAHFGNDALHDAEVVLAWCSVCILVIFLIDNVVLLALLRTEYLTDAALVLDMVVVVLSMALELLSVLKVMRIMTGGVLVAARGWRFARVAHGIYVYDERQEAIENHEEQTHDVTEESKKLGSKSTAKVA